MWRRLLYLYVSPGRSSPSGHVSLYQVVLSTQVFFCFRSSDVENVVIFSLHRNVSDV